MLHPCQFALRKNVKDFPWYSVDNNGEVRSLERNKALSYSVQKHGYTSVRLCKRQDDIKTHTRFLLHRLILGSFCGYDANKRYVDHKDNNPRNNSLNNLRWVTQSENVKKAYDLGRAKPPRTTTGKFGKLHHSSKPVAGYNEKNVEVVRFESGGLAKQAGYHISRSLSTGRKCKGLIFKYV